MSMSVRMWAFPVRVWVWVLTLVWVLSLVRVRVSLVRVEVLVLVLVLVNEVVHRGQSSLGESRNAVESMLKGSFLCLLTGKCRGCTKTHQDDKQESNDTLVQPHLCLLLQTSQPATRFKNNSLVFQSLFKIK